jgi:hypothetical protein
MAMSAAMKHLESDAECGFVLADCESSIGKPCDAVHLRKRLIRA